MTRDDIIKWLDDEVPGCEEVLLADGFEDAFVGISSQFSHGPFATYDYDLCVEILEERDGMDYAGAEEFLSYNVLGAWVGEKTPVFLRRMPRKDGAR